MKYSKVLCLAMTAFALSGCSSSEKPTPTATATTTVAVEEVEDTEGVAVGTGQSASGPFFKDGEITKTDDP